MLSDILTRFLGSITFIVNSLNIPFYLIIYGPGKIKTYWGGSETYKTSLKRLNEASENGIANGQPLGGFSN